MTRSLSMPRATAMITAIAIVAGTLPLASQAQTTTTSTAPTLSGTPKTNATVGTNYWFRPGCTDADGDALRFGSSGRPAWMTFRPETGAVYGTPPLAAAGRTYTGIKITCTDGVHWRSITWTLTVAGTGTTNRPPTISGTARTTGQVGTNYWFRPVASDPDGDTLTFSIVNKPAWLKFNVSTGVLSGTPTAANAGTYSNIVISVADGKGGSASLPSFGVTVAAAAAGEVVLTWTPPTSNADGTALTDLAGYTVSYGTASRSYSTSLHVAGAGTTSVVIEGLAAGTWYFAIKSRNVMGVESDYSGEVTAVL